MFRVSAIFTFTVLAIHIAIGRASADALVVTRAMKASTIAEIFVDDGQIRVELEVGVEDLQAFRNVLPDEVFEKLTGETHPLEERVQNFLDDDWGIRADQRRLEGTLERIAPAKRVIRDEVTGDPLVSQPDDAESVIHIELGYKLRGRPKSLSIRPPLDRDTNAAAANIGFIVYHQGVAVNDFRYLSREETLHLDWSDPWYSAFESKTLKRRYFAPAAAFVYVENFEVRKEIVCRPKDLQFWVNLGIQGKSTIKAAEREAICEKAAAFLGKHTPIEIDGKQAKGTLDRVHFIERTLRSSGVVEPNEDVDVNTALIGAIYVYAVDALPQKVTMGWDLFNERLAQIPTVATDEACGMPSSLDPNHPLLVWQNLLTNPSTPAFMSVSRPPQSGNVDIPVISLACLVVVCFVWIRRARMKATTRPGLLHPLPVTAALIVIAGLSASWAIVKIPLTNANELAIADKDATDITRSLLHNLYRAFDYRDESTIYDVLQRSVAGDLLTTIYLDTNRSLILAKQGGARVKVTSVELMDCQTEPIENEPGFVATCQWHVTGSVGHWGHLHKRKNSYRAEFVVSPTDGQWKIHDMQLLSEERVY